MSSLLDLHHCTLTRLVNGFCHDQPIPASTLHNNLNGLGLMHKIAWRPAVEHDDTACACMHIFEVDTREDGRGDLLADDFLSGRTLHEGPGDVSLKEGAECTVREGEYPCSSLTTS
jgi:hypothetical protein